MYTEMHSVPLPLLQLFFPIFASGNFIAELTVIAWLLPLVVVGVFPLQLLQTLPYTTVCSMSMT